MMNDSIEGILASIPGVQISLSGAGCLKNGALTEPAAFEFQAVSSYQRSRHLIAQIKEPWKYFQKNRGSVLTSLPFHGMMPASLERMILTTIFYRGIGICITYLETKRLKFMALS